MCPEPLKPLPVAGPSITDAEVAAVSEAVRTAWYGDAGRPTRAFEEAFAAQVGRRFAISLPSCTSGLHLALAAAGIGPDDEVLVPELTWIATSAPIQYVGASPIFVDVDPETLCISVPSCEAALTARTRAVIAVDLYGNMPDYEALEAFARRHDLVLIEDAAQAMGSRRHGRPAGAFGKASAFSFHGSKTLTTGEGGMLVTDSTELFERAMVLRDHGRRPGDVSFLNHEVAFKYKMSSMQAALGHAQLRRLSELVDRKRDIYSWYCRHLEGRKDLRLNRSGPGVFDSYWMTTALVSAELGLDKVQLMERLRTKGVDSRPIFYPLSSLPAYEGSSAARDASARNPVSYRLSPWGINLPSALCLTEEDVDAACGALLDVLRDAGSTA